MGEEKAATKFQEVENNGQLRKMNQEKKIPNDS